MEFHRVNWRRKRNIIDFVREKSDAHSPVSDRRARMVMMAAAWVMDYQNRVWHPDEEEFVDIGDYLEELNGRVTDNHLMSNVISVASRTQRTRPIWAVKEVSNDPEDWHTARMGTFLLRNWWYRLNIAERQYEADLWRLIDGQAVVRVMWDDLAEDSSTLSWEQLLPSGEINQLDIIEARTRFDQLTGGRGRESVRMGRGRPSVQVSHSLRLVLPDVDRLGDAPWLVEQRRIPISQLIDRHGTKVKALIDGQDVRGDPVRELEQQVTDYVIEHTGAESDDQEGDDCVTVDELWVPRNRLLPKGVFGTFLGDKTLELTDNPLPKKVRFAHVMIPWGPRMLGMHSTSPTIMALPFQAAYNNFWNKVLYHAAMIATPHVVTDLDEQALPDWKLNGPPGQIIRIPPGYDPPHIIEYGELPVTVLTLMQELVSQIQHIYGAHDVSHAQAPGGVRSGVALQTLESMDELRHALSAELNEIGWARVGEVLLRMAQENMIEPELIRDMGDQDSIEAVIVAREALIGPKSNADYAHVVVKNLNRLTLTRAAEQQRVAELIQMGVLDPAQHGMDILRGESTGATNFLTERLARQQALALRENNALYGLDDAQAQEVIYVLFCLIMGQELDPQIVARYSKYLPRDFQEHEVHVRMHDEFRDGDRYRNRMSYVQRLAADLHSELHRRLAARRMARDQAAAAREQVLEQQKAGLPQLQAETTIQQAQTAQAAQLASGQNGAAPAAAA